MPDLTFVLDDLVRRAGARNAIVLSVDGVLMAADSAFGKDDAEHLAAVAAGVQSLAKGAAARFGGDAVKQTLVEMTSANLLVCTAGPGACLAVLAGTGADTDVGAIAYQMQMMVAEVAEFVTSPPRPAADGEDPA
ncbi:MAG TPA: roadblock/LC7 domain-containing protein [Thermomonospora sp.]|nr:roadblock/LC7 domain-containing protein [Thermomonospora sp.]